MFDIGFSEMLVIAVVALVVLGPERLPKAARFAGLWVRRARAQWNSVKDELERELAADELKRELRIGMGPCQGRGCRDIIMREIAKATGKTFEEIGPGTMRPPVKPIKLSLLAKDFEDNPK